MIAAIASGKGGAGKTTVASSLVSVWDAPVAAVDLDVEEPNLHLFLHPEIRVARDAVLEVPRALPERCTGCGLCADLCQYGAVTVLGGRVAVFPQMCHGCGGCLALCPEGALEPSRRLLGEIQSGEAGRAAFLMGSLRVGEAMSPPLMREVKRELDALLAENPGMDAVIDAPPGVSCPAVSAVMDADAVVLVVEPTPFGLHDFRLAVEGFAPLGKPMGVVVNRDPGPDEIAADPASDAMRRELDALCADLGLTVLARIPDDPDIARRYARGEVVAQNSPELQTRFRNLRDALRGLPQIREALHA